MCLQYYLKILFEFLYGNSIFKYITMPTNFNHSKFKLNSHCSVCFATGLATIWAISGHLKRKISHYQIELFAIRNTSLIILWWRQIPTIAPTTMLKKAIKKPAIAKYGTPNPADWCWWLNASLNLLMDTTASATNIKTPTMNPTNTMIPQ